MPKRAGKPAPRERRPRGWVPWGIAPGSGLLLHAISFGCRYSEESALSARSPLAGDALLTAVTDAMIGLHTRYHHRAPLTAKTVLLDDELLACILGGVYTDVEKTMIELQQASTVRATRTTFQIAMQHKFIDRVEQLSGRRVLAFIPNNHVGPDLEIGLFMLSTAEQ